MNGILLYARNCSGNNNVDDGQGRVACCGSPMFLKHNYGVGYQLTVLKAQACRHFTVLLATHRVFMTSDGRWTFANNSFVYCLRLLQGMPSKHDAVCDIVSRIPGAEMISNVGTELSFRLPMQESAKLPAMLKQVCIFS
jgi:hypothetical protein